ncbi:hypothetical protein [Hymenobacter baengnokdamensis]|uniref:hypothetical protein n=1 Tax=Hymenobacter baengnokdamensis TaxID=2615203 RepID=UPI001248C341|nr:hypothetical protein [Hymenobacter baengnokdamensis]
MATLLSPPQLIEALLRDCPAHSRRATLEMAQEANQRILKQLDEQRLPAIEQGWDDNWHERHTRTTETLAHIEQALATC